MGLLAYQKAPCERLIQILTKHGAALDASDTGVGKTYVAVAVAKALGIPVGIVCPKSVIPSWERVTAESQLEPAFILNYEKLSRGNTDWITKDGKKFVWGFQGLIVWDEVHRCRTAHSLNANMLIAAWETQHIRCLCLSATAAQNPLEMRALGYVLKLHHNYDFWPWVIRLGARKQRWGGMAWYGSPETLSLIHHQIFPEHGVRVRIKELGNQFPENQIIPELIEIGSEESLADYNEALAEYHRLQEQEKKDGAEIMVAQLRARQKAEILKVPVLVERTKEFLDEEKSVVIFCNYNATLQQLAAELNTTCLIHGDQTPEERETNIQRFHRNDARICIANIQAGGVGVSFSDSYGKYPRVSLICPTYNPVDLRQALGRIHRADSKSPCLQYLLYAARTVETRVFRNVRAKLDRLDLLNDNELSDSLNP